MTTNKNPRPAFAIKVKKRLIELNMTQRQLAQEVGMNENYLTDVLAGRRSGQKYRAAIKERLNLGSDNHPEPMSEAI
jgi:transcriptional regulator with XRE-family HTH domain